MGKKNMFQTTNQMEIDFWVIKMMESLPFGPFGPFGGESASISGLDLINI